MQSLTCPLNFPPQYREGCVSEIPSKGKQVCLTGLFQ